MSSITYKNFSKVHYNFKCLIIDLIDIKLIFNSVFFKKPHKQPNAAYVIFVTLLLRRNSTRKNQQVDFFYLFIINKLLIKFLTSDSYLNLFEKLWEMRATNKKPKFSLKMQILFKIRLLDFFKTSLCRLSSNLLIK